MIIKISLFILILCLFESTINFQGSNICQKILISRKKPGGKQNKHFLSLIQQLKLVQHDPCIIELEPKYYWAQNMTFIIVKFDFQVSSRTSCSQVLFSQRNVSYDGFYIKQFCLQSDQIIKYEVRVKTYKNLNFHYSRWKQTQMNGLILESLKSPSPYFWAKLYSKATPPKLKPRIWWQLQQKQDQSVQKYMGLLQIDQSETQISSFVKKSKVNSQKKYKGRATQIQFYCNQGSPYLLGSWN